MDNFLNRLAPRPSDYGGLPGKITREDDAGNVYDETGRRIFNKFDQTDQPDSWLDTAISTATAPAKLATGLVGSLNPYGQDGWQVPPIISEPAAAFARSGESTGFGDDGQFYLPNVQNPHVAQDTLTQLMTVYGGNALNPLARVPRGGLASGAVKQAADSLPMDQASRLQRARDIVIDKLDGEYAAMSPDGDMMGNFIYEETPQAAFVLDASVKPEYRRQGVASTVYGAIQDDLGKPLTPDVKLTDDGYSFWKANYPEAVREHIYKDGYWVDPMGYIPDEVPGWRLAGGPNRPEGVLWSDNRPSLMGSALASQADALPMDHVRAYRGSATPETMFDGTKEGFLYSSSDPNTASQYAGAFEFPDGTKELDGTVGAVAPLDVSFNNPLTVDAKNMQWDRIPFDGVNRTIDYIAKAAANKGHDGLVVNRVRDGVSKRAQPSTTLVSLQRGTVASPTTGEILFSDNRPSLLGSALASGQGEEDLLALLGYR